MLCNFPGRCNKAQLSRNNQQTGSCIGSEAKLEFWLKCKLDPSRTAPAPQRKADQERLRNTSFAKLTLRKNALIKLLEYAEVS